MYHNAGQEVDHMPHKPQNKSKCVKFKQNAYLFQFQAAFCHVHVQERYTEAKLQCNCDLRLIKLLNVSVITDEYYPFVIFLFKQSWANAQAILHTV